MYNYCTLFDSNYLTRGLAMYESLKVHCQNFHLFIFAFDDRSNALLRQMNLEFVTIIALKEFEDEELLAIKDSRSAGEYCWTCTPSIIKYAVEKFNLESCTYLDADVYFYADPSVLIEEMKEASVLITAHRYTPQYDQTKTSGIYCVQFMMFKNDAYGMKVLNWWRDACNTWCFARFEDGKFGDQKYLDDWTSRFEGVHVLQHIGGGVAPWNVQQYNLNEPTFELIFYHFHGLKFLKDGRIDLGIYQLNKTVLKTIYKPYLVHLDDIDTRIKSLNDMYDYHGSVKKDVTCKVFLRNLLKRAQGVYNVFEKEFIKGL